MKPASVNHRDVSLQTTACCRSPRRSVWTGRLLACLAGLFGIVMTGQAQVSIYMGIGGAPGAMGATQVAPTLPGESTDIQYPKWVPVLSVQHGMTLPATNSPGGTTTGISQHSDVSVQKNLDSTSPSLNLLVNGVTTGLPVIKPIDYVTIDFRTAGATPIVFYRMELYNVTITSVSVSSGGDVPMESVSLKYQRIRWSYRTYANGKAGPTQTTGWDLIKNTSF